MFSKPRRVIEAVMFEGAIGPITAAELLALPEDTWGILRDRLTDGRRGNANGLIARCMMCESRVFIQTRVHGTSRLPYFIHYEGGDPNCPWYQGRTLVPDAARAVQYQGQQESKAHWMLCQQINELVSADPRYVRSTVAQYLPPTTSDFGRYPDVYVELRDLPPFAIELQLSNTFQTEVSARCLHYQREGVVLIWVLYGVDPQSPDVPQSFRDVIRRHRGNAFVLDKDAVEASRSQKTLVLKCHLKNAEESYDAPALVRLDSLTFPNKGLPYFQDRITGPLRQHIDERRKPWFKILSSLSGAWNWNAANTPDTRCAFSELRRTFTKLTYVSSENTELDLLRLIAVVFSVLSTANDRPRNYATAHANIRAMLNTLLNAAPEIQRHALLLEYLIQHTRLQSLLNGTVGKHIERAKCVMDGNLCLDHEPEWQVMAQLVPEVFDRVVREELVYLDALPKWAAPKTDVSSAVDSDKH